MCISLRKISEKLLYFLLPFSVFLLLAACDLMQPDNPDVLDSRKKNELMSQAEQIFQTTVESICSDGMNFKSVPNCLFDPGDVVPQWKESDFYRRVSDSGEEYWYVCTPVNVDFVFHCSVSGDCESEPVCCDVEMQTIVGPNPSCCLVYSMPEQHWSAANIGQKETPLKVLRSGKLKDGYDGLLIYTELNGMVVTILQFKEGASHPEDFDIFSNYRFGAYRVFHTKVAEENCYIGGEIEAAYCVAKKSNNDSLEAAYCVAYISNNTNNFSNANDRDTYYNGNSSSPYSGGSGGGYGTSGQGRGASVSYDRKQCFVGYDVAKDCMANARQTIAKMQKTMPTVRTYIATRNENGTGKISAAAAAKGVSLMIADLDSNQPVIVGVTHSNFAIEGNAANDNKATQHWLVVTGYQPDGDGYVFTYIETGRGAANWDAATSENNLLYYNRSTGEITGSNYKSNSQWNDYIVTETRTRE